MPRLGRLTLLAAVCLSVATCFFWVYQRRPSIALESGEIVDDLSVADVGTFASDRYAAVRKIYLSNLIRYRQASLHVIPTVDHPETFGQIRDAIRQHLARSKRDRDAIEAANVHDVDAVARLLAKVLMRASGQSLDSYLVDPVNFGGRFEVPGQLVSSVGPISLTDAVGSKRLVNEFGQWYEKYAANDGRSLIQKWGWTGPLPVMAFAVKQNDPEAPYADVVGEVLDRSELEYLRGGVSQSSMMFHLPPASAFSRGGRSVRFEVVFLVEDRSADRYPLWVNLGFDSKEDRWWLINAFRTTSVRAAASNSLSF